MNYTMQKFSCNLSRNFVATQVARIIVQCNMPDVTTRAKSKFLSISTDGLDRSIKFDWVRKSNAIELSHNFFGWIVFDCQLNRTQSFDFVRLSSIKFDYRTVRVVSSGTCPEMDMNMSRNFLLLPQPLRQK